MLSMFFLVGVAQASDDDRNSESDKQKSEGVVKTDAPKAETQKTDDKQPVSGPARTAKARKAKTRGSSH